MESWECWWTRILLSGVQWKDKRQQAIDMQEMLFKHKLFLGMVVKHWDKLPRKAVESPTVDLLKKHGHCPALIDHPEDLVISRGLFQPWRLCEIINLIECISAGLQGAPEIYVWTNFVNCVGKLNRRGLSWSSLKTYRRKLEQSM